MESKFKKLANKLIRRVLTLLGFSSTLAFMACYAPAMSDRILDVDPDTISFDAGGKEKQEVYVRAQKDWSVVEKAEFVELTSTSGKGDASVQVEAAPNEGSERQGLIVFEAEDDSLGTFRDTVVVVQKPV